MATVQGYISFPISKSRVTLSFQNPKHWHQFPWVLLARQNLLRQFVQELELERVNSERGIIEYQLDLPEETLEEWFNKTVGWSLHDIECAEAAHADDVAA